MGLRLCAGLILPVSSLGLRGEVGADTVRMQVDARGIERQVVPVERLGAGEVVRLVDGAVGVATVGARYQWRWVVPLSIPLRIRASAHPPIFLGFLRFRIRAGFFWLRGLESS